MLRIYKNSFVIFALFFASVSSYAQEIDFNRYHSQDEINTYLREVAFMHPNLATFKILGKSRQGRELSYLILSNGAPETAQGIYLNGTHHGDEKSSTESILAIIDHLVKNQSNPDVKKLLDNYAIYLQPLVNADGHAANTRGDSIGRDPNRDYSFPQRSDEDSFRLPEIALIKSLYESTSFRAAIAFHSGMEGVLWPWCHTGDRSPDHDTFINLSAQAAKAMNMSLFVQSYYDYPTGGEFTDYAYMKQQSLAVTFEVSNRKMPPASQLVQVMKKAITGTMTFMLGVYQVDHVAPRTQQNRLTAAIAP